MYVRMMLLLTAVLLALLAGPGETASGEKCDNGNAPAYTSVECVILGEKDKCPRREGADDRSNGLYVNQDGSSNCLVSAGQGLHVTCCTEDLVLFRGGQNLSTDAMSWAFATSLEGGRYECRWRDNGTSFANRSVRVDETVYVIPAAYRYDATPSFVQQCMQKIANDFNCSVSSSQKFYFVALSSMQSIEFNVLGARPIDLDLKMIWVKHYPVDLNLSLSSDVALNNTISHTAHINNLDNFVFVGGNNMAEAAYLVLTGTTSNRSSSMCVSVTLLGDPVLFTNESQPEDISVTEGQLATFHCDVRTNQETLPAFTVSLLARVTSPNFTECSNHTFSKSRHFQTSLRTDGSCFGVVVNISNSSDPLDPTDHTYYLTAEWLSPTLSLSGAEVVCAFASDGITQWARTATLTVFPTSSTLLPASPTLTMPPRQSSHPELRALAALSLLLLGGVALIVILLWRRFGHRWTTRAKASEHLQLEQTPLAMPSLPSSVSSTPNLPYHNNQLEIQAFTEEVYSGLELGYTEASNVVAAGGDSGLQVTTCGNLFFPPSHEVCVYISYSDSQADWVQDTLLPLLLSFQPIRVIDHEGHMIAGSVVSEERLRLLESADKVVAVISPDYQSTEWCSYELQHAVQQSSSAGAWRLIPILCDGCRELPPTIRTLHPLYLEDPSWHHRLRVAIRRQYHNSNQ